MLKSVFCVKTILTVRNSGWEYLPWWRWTHCQCLLPGIKLEFPELPVLVGIVFGLGLLKYLPPKSPPFNPPIPPNTMGKNMAIRDGWIMLNILL